MVLIRTDLKTITAMRNYLTVRFNDEKNMNVLFVFQAAHTQNHVNCCAFLKKIIITIHKV
jgi:hypothetical protein